MRRYIFILPALLLLLLVACTKSEVTVTSNQLYYNQYVGKGTFDEPFGRVMMTVAESKAKVNDITIDFSGTSALADIKSVKLFATADTVFCDASLLGEISTPSTTTVVMPIGEKLPVGNHVLWLTCDVREEACEGNSITAMPTSVTIDGCAYPLEATNCKRDVLLAYSIVYDLNQDGSKYYRIPALVTAPDGALVAISDKRGDILTDLPNTISIVSRRSTDGGRTWEDAVTVARGDSLTGKKYGDAAVVTDFVNNKIVAVFVGDKGLWDSTAEEPQRLYLSESYDSGKTWSEPRDITEQVYRGVYGRRAGYGMFAGSGHALQLESGRLMFVVAARHSAKPYQSLHNYAVYSDDFGETWKVSQNSPTPSPSNRGDEAKVVELANGDILMSIRNPEKGYRKFAISKTKGETWHPAYVSDNLIEPACDGDILRYTYQGKDLLIHSVPGSKTDRENVTIYVSTDNGKTWDVKRQLVDGMSAYSSLTILPDGTIGCLVEVGRHVEPTDIGMRMIYYNFSLDWIFNK